MHSCALLRSVAHKKKRLGDPEVLQEGSEDSCRLGRDPEGSSEHAATLEGRLGRQRAGNEVLGTKWQKVDIFWGSTLPFFDQASAAKLPTET